MSLSEFNLLVGYLSIAAAAGLLARLLWFHLAWRYGWLFAYFAADIVQGVLVIGVSRRSLWYGYVYFAGQGAKVLLAVGVSVQLWLLALRAYPALARFGRRIAIYIFLGALLLAAAGLVLEPPRAAFQSTFPHYFNAFEGTLDSTVGLFLVTVALFLLWFPVVVPRNVAVIIGGFLFYLLQGWAGLLLVNLYPQSAHDISAVSVSVEAGLLICWIVTVRPNGESVTTVTGHRWNPEEAERLLGQLNAINTRLEQAAR
jgi:hypothetical protein